MTFKSKVLGQWDPKDYADKQGETWVLDPAKFYPGMIAHIQKSLATEDVPTELIDKNPHPEIDPAMAARRYRNWARGITSEAWSDAHRSLLELPTGTTKEAFLLRVIKRAEALECARLWFTRALKNGAGNPVRIHILNDPDFRLGINLEFRA